nr:nitroreductase family protein [Mitsuokella multacida]
MNAIFTRTSVRKFEDRPVEKEKIEKLLQAGFVAPSARNHRSTATTPRRSTGSSKYILMREGIVCLPQNAIYC